jgi:hypothetical protein
VCVAPYQKMVLLVAQLQLLVATAFIHLPQLVQTQLIFPLFLVDLYL